MRYTASTITILAVHGNGGYQVDTSGHGTYWQIQFQSQSNQFELDITLHNGQLQWNVIQGDN